MTTYLFEEKKTITEILAKKDKTKKLRWIFWQNLDSPLVPLSLLPSRSSPQLSSMFPLVFLRLWAGKMSEQPFGEGKTGHKSFHQARICYFCEKCVVFACNCKFAKLNQCNMQYITCNREFLPKKRCFDPKSTFFCPMISKKYIKRDKS